VPVGKIVGIERQIDVDTVFIAETYADFLGGSYFWQQPERNFDEEFIGVLERCIRIIGSQ
jgi:hypothetical protein